MLLGVVVSDKAESDAISAANNVVAEVTYNKGTDTVRAQKYVKAGGKASFSFPAKMDGEYEVVSCRQAPELDAVPPMLRVNLRRRR